MVKPDLEKFLDLAQRSGLVERDRLGRVLDELVRQAGREPVTEPEPVAEKLVADGLITSWQRDKLLEGRHKGFFLKRYKLLDHLGTGGMSSVYLAEHVLMQRRVAIKVLPKNRVDDTSYLERFHRESQAAAALDHRNIVRAYDVDNEEDVHFLVMEYIDGRDLQVIVRAEGPLGYAVAAEYIRQAAMGLAHAHQAGLIHRDVKPGNLLVDRNGVVKVLDLGLARFTGEERASLTVAYEENVLGTADFLAPEQALDSHAVDARADIYSLGCSMFYILTGRAPFDEGTLPHRLMMHQKHPPPDIREFRPDAPEDLLAICLKMMAKKAEERHESAADVADALAGWLFNHGHSVDSGSGSSAQLAVAAAEARRLAQGDRGGPGREEDSSVIQRAKMADFVQVEPAEEETVTGQEQFTADGSPKAARDAASTPAADEVESPAAKPAEDESEPTPFFVHGESPMVERLKTGRSMTREEYEAYLQNRREIPLWVWGILGGGSLLVVILLILVLTSR